MIGIAPVMYAKGFYDGLKAAGERKILSLVRCAWAGSQKFGVLSKNIGRITGAPVSLACRMHSLI